MSECSTQQGFAATAPSISTAQRSRLDTEFQGAQTQCIARRSGLRCAGGDPCPQIKVTHSPPDSPSGRQVLSPAPRSPALKMPLLQRRASTSPFSSCMKKTTGKKQTTVNVASPWGDADPSPRACRRLFAGDEVDDDEDPMAGLEASRTRRHHSRSQPTNHRSASMDLSPSQTFVSLLSQVSRLQLSTNEDAVFAKGFEFPSHEPPRSPQTGGRDGGAYHRNTASFADDDERTSAYRHRRECSASVSRSTLWKEHGSVSRRRRRRSLSHRRQKAAAAASGREEGEKRGSSRRRNRGGRLPRRMSSMSRRSISIVSLPEGGYTYGSPFRRDRFADLGPCKSTNVNRIVCYNKFGNPLDPAVVLINGLGSSCYLWPEEMCVALASSRLFVIRFDNRDSGLTTHWDNFPCASFGKTAILSAFTNRKPPYTLSDMATDVVDLMDYLGIFKAHLVGISMGGMIAQKVALFASHRVNSLSLLATHCPGYRVSSPDLALIISNFMDSPKNGTVNAIVDFYVRRRQDLMGGYNADTPTIRRILKQCAIRSPGDGKAVKRQFWAVQSEKSQEKEVKALALRGLFPVLVVHGKRDPMIPVANSKMLASLWTGSELRLFEKMGHVVPKELEEDIEALIFRNVDRSSRWMD